VTMTRYRVDRGATRIPDCDRLHSA
jgi:hypothetical protein